MSVIGIIGGTGPQGRGLGYRFALAGHEVILGSRAEDRARKTAAVIEARGIAGSIHGAVNAKAAEVGELVLLAIPYSGQDELISTLRRELSGKVVISCVNPLGFDERGPYGLDLGGTSAAEVAQELLPTSSVIGAFHHLSATRLSSETDDLRHEDVLVCGDEPAAKRAVIELATSVTGKPGIDAGPLRLARQLEPLTAVLISVNKRYKVRSGIALAGLPSEGRSQ